MKPSWQWDESDLLSLIADRVQESIDLDYKQSEALEPVTDSKKNELSKDVSAFANSAGGTILYGVAEDKRLPVRLDSGCDPRIISREWLEQVINSRIHRKIDRIRINQIDLMGASPGRVAYAVHIPQSTRAPHQAGDKRFYKRYNFESVPMEEYEIRDVARRTSKPLMELECKDIDLRGSGQKGFEADCRFQVSNISDITGTFAVVTIGLFLTTSARWTTTTDWRWVHTADDWKVARCVVASGSSLFWSPITPGYTLVLPTLRISGETREQDVFTSRLIGFARLDHDGGQVIRGIDFWREGKPGNRIRLKALVEKPNWPILAGAELVQLFDPSPSSDE